MRNRTERKRINSQLITILFTVLLNIGFGLPVAEAFHFPWDQGTIRQIGMILPIQGLAQDQIAIL